MHSSEYGLRYYVCSTLLIELILCGANFYVINLNNKHRNVLISNIRKKEEDPPLSLQATEAARETTDGKAYAYLSLIDKILNKIRKRDRKFIFFLSRNIIFTPSTRLMVFLFEVLPTSRVLSKTTKPKIKKIAQAEIYIIQTH